MPALAFQPINPYGKRVVAAAGTPVLLFTTAEVPVSAAGKFTTRVSRIYLEALNTNTGFIYIGVKGMVKATLAGVIQTLPPPNLAKVTNYVDWTENFAGGTNNYQLQDYWIDADVNGEGLIRSVWVW
jgi:hypothetical protein